MRLFFDANVLFSAAKSNGAVRELLERALKEGHECWVDEFVVTEVRRNLLAKGPGSMPDLEQLLARFRIGPAQAGVARAETAWLPEKDRPVLAAAMHLRCDALVTGDRTHFGSGYGKLFAGVAIHTPRSLAEALWPS